MGAEQRIKRYAGRKDSSRHQFLGRVPADLLDRMRGRQITLVLPGAGLEPEHVVTVTAGRFVKLSLKTRDAATGMLRRKAVEADLARVYDAARRGPAPLSQRQILALSGEVYRQLISQNEENPGTPDEWERFKGLTRAALEHKIPGAPEITHQGRADDEIMAELVFGSDMTADIDAAEPTWGTRALEQRCSRLAFWVLARHGLEIDSESRLRLLQEVARAALQAAWTLKSMSKGNYAPDPEGNRFPEWRETAVTDAPAASFDTVHRQWCETEKARPGSQANRRKAIQDFAKHAGTDDMAAITGDHVMAWRDAMIEQGLAAGTIKTRLSDVRSAFSYGRSRKLFRTNPFLDLKLAIKATRLAPRKRMQAYARADVARLLHLASQEKDPGRRWLPLLAATTGARIAELTQFWAERVRELDGVWMMQIRPAEDGGSVKTEASSRDVPIHPDVIAGGFLEFVRAKGQGPLFYKRRPIDPTKSHPSKPAGDVVGKWIRGAGFANASVAPFHGLRHYWKTQAHLHGVDSVTADFLQGHRTPGEASRYRHLADNPKALREAVARIPLPEATPDLSNLDGAPLPAPSMETPSDT